MNEGETSVNVSADLKRDSTNSSWDSDYTYPALGCRKVII